MAGSEALWKGGSARPVAWAALTAVGGGALMVAGSMMPWLSLFAGLRPYPGTTGMNGWILVGAGIVSAVGGFASWIRPDIRVSRSVGAIGCAAAAFSLWIGFGLVETYRGLLANPMMVPSLGPGLFLAGLGALLVAASPWLRPAGVRADGKG